ncbi:aldo/keto reductase [Verrucomicrobium sp. BvORR106]|uniref:aldo/keto reductase n=1 Tax=Verrucomicrobium sp. BvORR106 TaxID=1403819 RepID=UPI000570380A|nr:aldo/keto reductase [Verrucomicrobium sp. BvORR106]
MKSQNTTRRNFLAATALGSAAMVATASAQAASGAASTQSTHYRPPHRFGLGGVAIGNGFKPTSDSQAEETLAAAWASGVRYFDTSPWYGLGLSERRFGHFLHNQKREDYVISTKVGRLLKAGKPRDKLLWKEPSPFVHTYDYTADGVRRSIEDSLQRLGVESIDIVFIHDLSPDNGDLGERWTEQFNIAAKGAMPALTKMREEGLIKAWGLGVNTIEPALATLKVADPDIFLSATQYSLMHHEDALNRLFPACDDRGVSIVVGAPLNAGFLAGLDRYDYSGKMPESFKEKRARISTLANKHGTDLRTAALQFTAAPPTVSATIPGARSAQQVTENATSMKAQIPAAFWTELKNEGLIAKTAPTPSIKQ